MDWKQRVTLCDEGTFLTPFHLRTETNQFPKHRAVSGERESLSFQCSKSVSLYIMFMVHVRYIGPYVWAAQCQVGLCSLAVCPCTAGINDICTRKLSLSIWTVRCSETKKNDLLMLWLCRTVSLQPTEQLFEIWSQLSPYIGHFIAKRRWRTLVLC
jgi:hypothetical protein